MKTDKDTSSFFPDYEPARYPERDFLFAMLSTTSKGELIKLIKNTKNNRSYSNQIKEDEMIQVKGAMSYDIFNVLQSKFY